MKMDKRKLKVSFLEREFFAGSADGLSIPGHEPIIASLPEGDRLCRAIYPERLKKAQFTDTLRFQTEFPFEDFNIDLAPILGGDEGGKRWLEMFRKYCELTYGKDVPPTLTIGPSPFPKRVKYSLLPSDYMERKKSDRRYRAPSGILTEVPRDAVYRKVEPPMRFSDGEWLPCGLSYSRKVLGVSGSEWSCSLADPLVKNHLNIEGALLGRVEAEDLVEQQEDFEGGFPFRHSVRLAYLAAISQLRELNPLSIHVELTN